MRSILVLLSLLYGVIPSAARTTQIAWTYPPGLRQTGFALQACLATAGGCPWQETQHLGAQQRQTQVQLPGNKKKCFRLFAVRGTERSAPSNELCLQ